MRELSFREAFFTAEIRPAGMHKPVKQICMLWLRFFLSASVMSTQTVKSSLIRGQQLQTARPKYRNWLISRRNQASASTQPRLPPLVMPFVDEKDCLKLLQEVRQVVNYNQQRWG